MPNLVHDLVSLLLGSEYFNRESTSKEEKEIGNRVRLQEAIDGQHEFVKYGLLPPRGVGDRLNFWEGGGDVVFTEVNYPGDHAEGGQRVQVCGGIVPSEGTSNNSGDC